MKLFSLCMLLFLAGCAPYALAPLTTGHPAHPDAMAAPQQPASRTLAYTSSDLPTPRVAATAAVAQQGDHEAHHETQSSMSQTIVGDGKAIATVPSAIPFLVALRIIQRFEDATTGRTAG